jgi:hypothetical protein
MAGTGDATTTGTGAWDQCRIGLDMHTVDDAADAVVESISCSVELRE